MAIKKIELTEKECEQILEKVDKRKSSFVKEAKKYNVSAGTIVANIKRQIPEKYHIFQIKRKSLDISKEKCEELFEKYKNGYSLSQIAKEINRGRDAVKSIFKNYGFDIKDTSRYGRMSDYNINENYFENIDNEEKAYWLGFFLGDGYITKDNKNIELTLKAEDKEHVEKFKKVLNTQNEVCFKKNVNAYRIYCTSEKMCQDLNKLGVYNNKSLTYKLNIDILLSEYGRDYIRGLIDANGCISINKDGKYTVSLTCNEFVGNQFKTHINIFNNKTVSHSKKSKACDIRVSNDSAKLFLQFLYKDANVYLERKFKKAFAVLEDVVVSNEGLQEVLVS